jgi:hypothetical protein
VPVGGGRRTQRLSDSVRFTLPDAIVDELAFVPDTEWQPAYDADRETPRWRWGLEVTGLLGLSRWPTGSPRSCRSRRRHAWPIMPPSRYCLQQGIALALMWHRDLVI